MDVAFGFMWLIAACIWVFIGVKLSRDRITRIWAFSMSAVYLCAVVLYMLLGYGVIK